MNPALPPYYFRIRENGAAVYRVDVENRFQRIEMDQIAVVNLKNGEVKPQGKSQLTEADHAAIAEWTAARQALMADRQIDDIRRTIDHLNLTAQWAQSKASGDELEAITDELLMAMHDLRSVLVRKKSDRMTGKKD